MLKVSQRNAIYVTRLLTHNSHNTYRDSKQTDKAVYDLATQSLSSAVQGLLVSFLNKANVWVKEAHNSNPGFEFPPSMCPLSNESIELITKHTACSGIEDKKSLTSAAPTSKDALPHETPPSQPKHKRVEPERLIDQLTQIDKYRRYGQLKWAKTDCVSSSKHFEEDTEDVEYVDKNPVSDWSKYNDDQDEGEDSKLDLIQEMRLMDNLKLNALSSKDIKTYYNKLQTAEQENWSQDQ